MHVLCVGEMEDLGVSKWSRRNKVLRDFYRLSSTPIIGDIRSIIGDIRLIIGDICLIIGDIVKTWLTTREW